MSGKLRTSTWDKTGVISSMLAKVALPKFVSVKQIFEDSGIKDIYSEVDKQFSKPEISGSVKPGDRIAITVGSRGIANIATITKAIVDNVKKLEGIPFIVPAMGSHGGATAEGQRETIESLGVTEEFLGCEILSSMEVADISSEEDDHPVYIDKNALSADGIIVSGRIKPHTAFRGDYESGLFKMMTIGLGKQIGAEYCHNEGFGKMAENVPKIARCMIRNAPIIMGFGIIENSFDDTCILEAIPAEKIEEEEPRLLIRAKELMPAIKFDEFDILIVDKIGKNFSGDGMDPNITSTFCTPYASGGPDIQKCVVLDVSEETHGNGIGVGMSDFSTQRLYDKFDFDAAYVNALTCTVTKGARIPMILKSDKLAISAAVFTAVGINKENPRIVRIANTSHIDHIMISEALLSEALNNESIEVISELENLPFNEEGNLF